MTSQILGRKQCFIDKNNCKHNFCDGKIELDWKKIPDKSKAANANEKTKLLLLQPNKHTVIIIIHSQVFAGEIECALRPNTAVIY